MHKKGGLLVRKLAFALALLLAFASSFPLSAFSQEAPPGGASVAYSRYGTSGRGRPLELVSVAPAVYSRTLLLVFGVHGFEDAWPRDGEELLRIANAVADYFASRPEELRGARLLVVPCANPDGLWDGWTNAGPGRCQVTLGIDVNRDFPVNFTSARSSRYRVGRQPFSTPEARALRDLVLREKPDVVADFHGWMGEVKGDPVFARPFATALGIPYRAAPSGPGCLGGGQFVPWAASLGIRAVLVEYPNPVTGKGCLWREVGSVYKSRPKGKLAVDSFAAKIARAVSGVLALLAAGS